MANVLTLEDELKMVKMNGYNIQFCYHYDYMNDLCYAAINQNGLALKYINPLYQTDELCIIAIKNNYRALKYVSIQQTYKMCILSLYKSDGKCSIIPMIKNQEITIFCEILKKYPLEIRHVKPSKSYDQLCMLALKRNGLVLRYINFAYLTNEMYYVALNNNGMAIKYINPSVQTDTLALLALRQNVKSIKYIYNRTSEMWTFALKKDGLLIKYLNEDDFIKYKFSQEKLYDVYLILLQIAIGQNKMALILALRNKTFNFINDICRTNNICYANNEHIYEQQSTLLINNKKNNTKRIVRDTDTLFDIILNDLLELCGNKKEVIRAIEQYKINNNYNDYIKNNNLYGYYFCLNKNKNKYIIIFKPRVFIENYNNLLWSINNGRSILKDNIFTTQIIITYQII